MKNKRNLNVNLKLHLSRLANQWKLRVLILPLFDVLGSSFLVSDCDAADFDRPLLRLVHFSHLLVGIYNYIIFTHFRSKILGVLQKSDLSVGL